MNKTQLFDITTNCYNIALFCNKTYEQVTLHDTPNKEGSCWRPLAIELPHVYRPPAGQAIH